MTDEAGERKIEASPRAALTRAILVAAIGLLLFGYLWLRFKSVPARSATVHAMAPDFSLSDLNGRTLSLAQYRGKVVLLNFWATWCAPCRGETPQLVKLQDAYGQQGLRVIGISMDDDSNDVPPFYREFHINYPVAVGDAHIADRFGGILGLPVTFVVGCDGRIESRSAGALNFSATEAQIKTLLQDQACKA